MTDRTVTLGAAQISEVPLDRDATVEKDLKYIREAGEKDIDLLVFPEYHISGPDHWYYTGKDITIDGQPADVDTYYAELYKNGISATGSVIEQLGRAAQTADTAVVMGGIEQTKSGSMYNAQFFIDKTGELIGVRRKLVPTKTGRVFFARGTGKSVATFDSEIGNISGLMCGEHTNPLAIFSLLSLGEQIHAASWPALPWREPVASHYGIRTRYLSVAGKIPSVLASGIVTEELADWLGRPEWEGSGGASGIIGPGGDYLAGPKTDGTEGIVHADVDMSACLENKASHDILGHYNRFDIFSLEIDRETPDRATVVDDDTTRNIPVHKDMSDYELEE